MEHLIPARALATDRQTPAPEGIEPQLPPQLAAQPACAPLSGPAQRHLREPDTHDGQFISPECLGRIFFREQGDLLRGLIILTKELDALAPRSFLAPIEFAQIQDMALHDAITAQAAISHHTPVEVFFAIFAPRRTTKEHDGR